MTTRPKPKKKKNKIGVVLLLSALFLYGILQWYLMNNNKIETVKATEGFINDSIMTMGIICRDEVLLRKEENGYLYYNVENGQRVSSGMLVGELYNDIRDVNLISTKMDLTNHIESLQSAQNFMNSVNLDISIIRRQLNNSLTDITGNIVTGNYNQINNQLSEAAVSLNKINVAMQKEGDIHSYVEELQENRRNVSAQINDPIRTFYSPSSGYFIKSIDGYENSAQTEKIKALSAEEGISFLLNPLTSVNSQEYYGKIITDYKWNLCLYVTAEQAKKLAVEQMVRLSIDTEQNQYQKVEVGEIIPMGEHSLVILNSTTMDSKSATTRISECEILFAQYKGIKVPRSALRIKDNELGVYVKFSKLVRFKKVNPIYEDENYIILPLTPDETNEVSLYDDIIVKGVNLYDGKFL